MRYFGIRQAHTDMVININTVFAFAFWQEAKSTQKNKEIVKLRLVWLKKKKQ